MDPPYSRMPGNLLGECSNTCGPEKMLWCETFDKILMNVTNVKQKSHDTGHCIALQFRQM